MQLVKRSTDFFSFAAFNGPGSFERRSLHSLWSNLEICVGCERIGKKLLYHLLMLYQYRLENKRITLDPFPVAHDAVMKANIKQPDTKVKQMYKNIGTTSLVL